MTENQEEPPIHEITRQKVLSSKQHRLIEATTVVDRATGGVGLTTEVRSKLAYEMYKQGLHADTQKKLKDHVLKRSAVTEAALAKEARTDPLTGLHNRRWLMEQLPQIIAISERSGSPLTILFLDVDNFKEINDRYGHDGGDKVLQIFSQCLKRKGDAAVRYAGDEFILLLPGTASGEVQQHEGKEGGAHSLATELLTEFQNPQTWNAIEGFTFSPTCSIGIAQQRHENPNELIKMADSAAYAAKNAGKGQAVIWRPGMREKPSVNAMT